MLATVMGLLDFYEQAADGGSPLTTEQFIARVISQANLCLHDDRSGVAPATDAHGLTEA